MARQARRDDTRHVETVELLPAAAPTADAADPTAALLRIAHAHVTDGDLLTARALAFQALEMPGAPAEALAYARGLVSWIDPQVPPVASMVPDPFPGPIPGPLADPVADPSAEASGPLPVGSLPVGSLPAVDLRAPDPGGIALGALPIDVRSGVPRAERDDLTDLANRPAIRRLTAETLSRGVQCAVLVVDLDRFGRVNESYGHATGDELLSEVARRITGAVRSRDVVARWGGDEFVVLMNGVSDRTSAVVVAESVRDALARPWPGPDGTALVVSASIGVAISVTTSADADDLLRQADAATERAKGSGKDRIEVWGGRAEDDARHRLEVESMIRSALEHRWFRLFFQPVHANAPGQPLAAEALLRLDHPELGLLAPGAFLAVAEETGLTRAIGEWVLEESCRIASRWIGFGRPFHFAINVSPRQLDADLPAAVADALVRHRISADMLTLELTEHALLEADDEQVAVLEAVRAQGVHIALDDFGTAYSSFSHLRRFPVDVVKIDRSFVAGIGTSEKDTAIIQAVVDLSHSFGFRVIAEGVETAAQLDQQRRLGCHGAQGYLIGRPRDADQFGELLITLPMFSQMLDPTLF